MSLPDRKDVRIRLTENLVDRLERVLKHLGQTRQTFFCPLAKRAIEDAEAEMKISGERRKPNSQDSRREGPTGLGLNFHRAPDIVPRQSEPSPVVVNVGSTAKGDVEEQADYVVSGPDYERDGRMRDATEKLKQKLEDAVGRKTKEPEDDLARLRRGAASVFTGIKGLFDS